MILKASQRANASNLSRHLLNVRDNEHVEIHDLRGFIADDLDGALREAECIAKGTRCKQFLFSLSMSPPQDEVVPIEVFETALAMVEQKLGLDDQPRAVVFHEKDGRRHAHAVYSRIDADSMTAINLPFFKNRLMEVSKELFLEHGWSMPKGMIERELRNPLNFTRDQYQQAKRLKIDPRLIKAAFQEAWRTSDSAESLKAALAERGFYLAKGNKRVVAVDHTGEVYALAKWSGVKARDVNTRVTDAKSLPSLDERRAEIASLMQSRLREFEADIKGVHARQRPSIEFRRTQMIARHRKERALLSEKQNARWAQETAARAARLPKGIGGLWARITGRFSKIKVQNELEAWKGHLRDRDERDRMIARQLDERGHLQLSINKQRDERARDLMEIRQEIAVYLMLQRGEIPSIVRDPRQPERPAREFDKNKDRDRSRERGPDFDL